MKPWQTTTKALSYYIDQYDILKWYRILYTILLTVGSRWVFVKSDINYVAWHQHNTALVSGLLGMWLITISHFITTPNIYYNTLANDFFQSALPSTGLFALVFSVLYSPNEPLPDADLQMIAIYDAIYGLVLLIDSLFNGLIFDFNEFSFIPLVGQAISLIV